MREKASDSSHPDREKPLTILGIGAHPDDCESRMAGTAAMFAALGHRVVLASVTNGQSGHHLQGGAALVARRKREAAAAAELIGAESIVLPIADGHLDARLDYRFMVIRMIREVAPDLIITNRPNDYHPDHRYTSLLVQDSAYMVRVPHVAPETPALPRDPIILYWYDHFQQPAPFRPDIVVAIDSVAEKKLAMLDRHESQVYEWLPWVDGVADQVPETPEARLQWLASRREHRMKQRLSDLYRDSLRARYGDTKANAVVQCEAFALCEYGSRPTLEELSQLFAGM